MTADIPFAKLALLLGLVSVLLAAGYLMTPGVPQAGIAAGVISAGIAVALLVGEHWARRAASILSQRRKLFLARRTLAAIADPAFLVGEGGAILAQNAASIVRDGVLTGGRIQDDLALGHAEPDRAWQDIRLILTRSGDYQASLLGLGSHLVRRLGTLQLWQAVPKHVAPEPEANKPVSSDFDRLPVAIVILQGDARIIRLNEAARDLLGDAMPGQSIAAHLDGLGREICDWVADISAGRMSGGSEVLHLKAAGGDRFVQVGLTRDGADQVIAVLSDASAMKTLEAQFVQSQKMQAIGQLAGGIAHDFNNLLTAITGHCDLLMLRRDKSDPDYSDLDQISQNANRAAALVRQLLAFSRKQTLKPQIMDLRDTLADLTHLLNRLVGERIYLTFEHDPTLRMIRADRRQLEQVIMNLVVNARDAMPNGGDISITTDNLQIDGAMQIGKARLPAGEYVRVQVRDQGCGISDDDLGKIFEPFYTTKRLGEGTGLGLSTAYGIVKQTGGYIFCDSQLGHGSTFALYFPAHDRPVKSEVAQEAIHVPAPRHEPDATVLLVEDEAPVRAFASRALKLQGLKVIEAASAEEALSLLTDHRLSVDVFVTDVVMPGMDGPAWVRTALRDRPQTRVVFMSGYAEDAFGEGHVPVPNSAFLAKPFSLTELTSLVSQQLQRAPVSLSAQSES